MNKETIKVLLVEDDDLDREAIHRAFDKHDVKNPIVEAHDGLHALELLCGSASVPQLEPPYIILLDIAMPRMNGHEFLETLRTDIALKRAVVFVLTTSNDDEDRFRAYNHHVAGYILKSEVGPSFSKLIRLVEEYIKVVELPN